MSAFNLPKPDPSLPRNGFDLSSRRVFSAPAGALLPVGCWETNPGEHFRISVSDLVRTRELNTAAFTRCKEYYHFFFVPYKSLWSSSDKFFTGVSNSDSSLVDPRNFFHDSITLTAGSSSSCALPTYDSSSFDSDVLNKAFNSVPSKTPNFNLQQLLDKLCFKLDKKIIESGLDSTELSASLQSFKRDSLGYRYSLGSYRLLHMLGYGVYPNGKVRCSSNIGFDSTNDKKSISDSDLSKKALEFIKKSDEYKNLDIRTMPEDEFIKIYDKVLRLLSSPGNYGSYTAAFSGSFRDTVRSSDLKFTPNPFRLFAYQRIYNDFYRNDNYEKSNPLSFNCDFAFSDKNLSITTEQMVCACQLRYRHWSKDWLTSVVPTPNYNEGIFNLPLYVGTSGSSGTVFRDDLSTSIQLQGNQTFNVQDIRAAFALDKMLEATRRANGLDYSSQIAAHFGFNVPESRRNCAQFIGGFDNVVSISEVVSQSSGSVDGKGSQPSVTGQVFGKGLGSLSSDVIEFDSKEHGVIMCIYSVSPQVDYNAYNMDSFNRKLTREDYYQPEFQNLGYQPLEGLDFALTVNPDGTSDNDFNNSILGYTPRYMEYKTARDVIFNNFMSGGSLSAWCTPRNDLFRSVLDNKNKKFFSVNPTTLLVDPAVLNPIFAFNYDGTTETDQFLVNSYFDVKAVRPMSVYGLSQL